MTYATCYIVRFEGSMTQGPNKGKSYTFANSWGGVQFDTKEQALALVAKYCDLEPSLTFRVLSRQFREEVGTFVEETVSR